MRLVQRPVILILTLAAVAGVLILRGVTSGDASSSADAAPGAGDATLTAAAATAQALPRIVEFGADRCVPCKAMKPVLAELRTAHAGRLVVETVDVWKDRDAGTRAGIASIPTQIFYAADGRELRRHTGFISRADIESTFADLGVDLTQTR